MRTCLVFAALVLSAPALAACPSGTVQITGTLTNPDGSGLTGRLLPFRGYTDTSARENRTAITVTAGSMVATNNGGLVCLVPGNYSVANFVGSSSLSYATYWVVPSSGPVTVQSIETSTAATPAISPLPLSLLAPNLTAVLPIVFNGGTGVFSCPTCGSGGGGGAWGTITGTLSAQTDLQTAIAAKEPAITAGTTAQYWRGDKSWRAFATDAVAALSGLYEVPITFGAGLNRTTNTITVPALGITNGMLAGSIAASKLVGSDISIANTQVTGLGTASTQATGAFDASGLAAAAIAASAQRASNLSDLANAATARTNLGLTAVAASGSASDLSTGTLAHARLPALLSGDIPANAGGASWTTAGNTHLFTFMDSGRAPNMATTGFSTYTSKVVYVTALPANVSGLINSIDAFYQGPLGGSAGGAVAVYSDNGSGTRTLLASQVSLSNGQPQTWALSGTVTISAGSLYWLAWCTDSATAALYSITHNANEIQMYNIGTQIRSATAASPCTGSGAGLTFPATLGALTANASGDAAPYLQGRP